MTAMFSPTPRLPPTVAVSIVVVPVELRVPQHPVTSALLATVSASMVSSGESEKTSISRSLTVALAAGVSGWPFGVGLGLWLRIDYLTCSMTSVLRSNSS